MTHYHNQIIIMHDYRGYLKNSNHNFDVSMVDRVINRVKKEIKDRVLSISIKGVKLSDPWNDF